MSPLQTKLASCQKQLKPTGYLLNREQQKDPSLVRMIQEIKCPQHFLTILTYIPDSSSTSSVTNLNHYYPSILKLSYKRFVQKVPEVRAWSSSASVMFQVVQVTLQPNCYLLPCVRVTAMQVWIGESVYWNFNSCNYK